MRLAGICVSCLSVDESPWYRLSFPPRWERLNQINALSTILVQPFLSAVKTPCALPMECHISLSAILRSGRAGPARMLCFRSTTQACTHGHLS